MIEELYNAEENFYKKSLEILNEDPKETARKLADICSSAHLKNNMVNDCMTGPDLSEYVSKSQIIAHLEKDINRVVVLINKIENDIKQYDMPLVETHNNNKLDYNVEYTHYVSKVHRNNYWAFNHLLYTYDTDSQMEYILEYEVLKHLLLYLNEILDNLEDQHRIYEKGEKGEENVGTFLSMLEYKYIIKQNVILPANGVYSETSETDAYIITDKGIFVCEIKNWGGPNNIIKITNGGQWLKCNKFGETIDTMHSPVEQNTQHCIATEQFLKAHGIEGVKVYPIIVMANEHAIFENNSNNTVLRTSELYNFIENFNGGRPLSKDIQQKIGGLFEQSTNEIAERKFPIVSCDAYIEGFQRAYDQLKEMAIAKTLKIKQIVDMYKNDVFPLGEKTDMMWESTKKKWFLVAKVTIAALIILLLTTSWQNVIAYSAGVFAFMVTLIPDDNFVKIYENGPQLFLSTREYGI